MIIGFSVNVSIMLRVNGIRNVCVYCRNIRVLLMVISIIVMC